MELHPPCRPIASTHHHSLPSLSPMPVKVRVIHCYICIIVDEIDCCYVVPNLHYLLSNTCQGALKFNTAFPFHPSTCLPPNLNPTVNELAISPPVQVLRLRVSAVNLVFDVTNPCGVLVADVFKAIFAYLQNPLSRDVYGSLPSHVREATDRAYQHRLQKASSRRIQGINERLAFVDCLGERIHFHSLTYCPSHGVWDVVMF